MRSRGACICWWVLWAEAAQAQSGRGWVHPEKAAREGAGTFVHGVLG